MEGGTALVVDDTGSVVEGTVSGPLVDTDSVVDNVQVEEAVSNNSTQI